ncbi:hypothetical protein [Leucobacter ruminantium]|uniref:ABC-2 type transport system permease protein n=1 Tax=Leucobacter ruminantium TaxID=1289170 RepID=A0A939LZT6_9MICO|nr:hypothetical protein [Leucobacter ruminantium]
MAARLLRLRVALLGGAFRGSFLRGLRTVVLFLLLAAGAVALALLPGLLIADAGELRTVDTVIGGLLLAAVFVVPFFENRRLLDARQFAQFPAGPGTIAISLLLTSVISRPFLLLAIWLVSLGVLRPGWHSPGWAAPVAFVLAALLAMCSVRVSAGISRLMAGARHAGTVRTVGVLLAVAFLPVAVFAVTTALSGGVSGLGETARILGWTPFGAPFAGLALLAAGDTAGGLIRLGIVAVSVLLLLVVWVLVATVSNQRIDRPLDPGIARSGLGWFERFAARPSQVIAARELTYWARDPRYRVALFAIPVAPIIMLVALWIAGVDPHTLALVPLPVILLLLGWSQHNDIAMDSTAIWTHVASGTRGRADRAGRLAPVMMIGIPLALIGSSITVTLLGDWRVLPSVLGLNLGVLLVSSASSSVFSVLMPYPATRPGDSPFVQPQWSGSGSGLAQTLSIVTALVLSAPVVWMSVNAMVHVEFADNAWALLFGAGYGAAVLGLGIVIGGWLFDRSAPELIAVTQVFD